MKTRDAHSRATTTSANASLRARSWSWLNATTFAAAAAMAAIAAIAFVPSKAAAEGLDIRAHLKIDDDAKEASSPLSIYPGATRAKKRGNSSESVKIDFALGSFGFKLNVLTLATEDAPEKVAAYYRRELSRYGELLDCSLPRKDPERLRVERETKLRCKNARNDEGVTQFRAGRKNQEYVVVIEPRRIGKRDDGDGARASGSDISLVYVNLAKNGEPIESSGTEVSIQTD
jgi:hypothetical protein